MSELSSLVSAGAAQMRSDPVMFWALLFGIIGCVAGLITGLLIARGNARMRRETKELLAQSEAERDAAQAAVDALAGRPAAQRENETEYPGAV